MKHHLPERALEIACKLYNDTLELREIIECFCLDAELAQSVQPVAVSAAELPPMYLCPNGCGCEWRDNGDGTMSLYDGFQKSCRVCETLPIKDLVPMPDAPGDIAQHLYADQRHDGMWLVCVESQYATRPEAQAACRSWIRHHKIDANIAQPAQPKETS